MSTLQEKLKQILADAHRERQLTQMTLGKLIARLNELPPSTLVEALGTPHSYRGYYSDLAFEPGVGQQFASRALEVARSALGEVFEGYKGGDYMMTGDAPVWIASYGYCGRKLMGITDDGKFETAEDQ